MKNPNKFLVVGLGNVGDQYNGTRHNVGFRVANALAPDGTQSFTDERYGAIARMRLKNKELVILKPSTFMNLSGNAVRYWSDKENVPLKNILIVVDELALPFGTLRMKTKGSDGGHNGLKHIAQTLGTQSYTRLRVGIGNEFNKGEQVDYVLSPFSAEQEEELPNICERAVEFIKTFCLAGADIAMNQFNTKIHPQKKEGNDESAQVGEKEG